MQILTGNDKYYFGRKLCANVHCPALALSAGLIQGYYSQHDTDSSEVKVRTGEYEASDFVFSRHVPLLTVSIDLK